jgi:predicted GIY-YIG superfamily endonuclease
MLIRDRLLARIVEMGGAPDHQRLAAEVLGISNAPPELARRLVAQALVVEDRRDAWRRAGERIAANAPAGPGVYVLQDETARAVYVGKANNLRRRLRAHFAERRWRGLKAPFARIAGAEWHEVGSEIEALLREASLIEELRPEANVQVAAPSLETRAIPPRLVRDVIVVLPSVDPASAELVAARADGGWLLQRTPRDGSRLKSAATLLTRFFRSPLRDRFESPRLAPIVFSWLAGRGVSASRIDPHDAPTVAGLRVRLQRLLADDGLFTERIVMLNSEIRTTHRTRP